MKITIANKKLLSKPLTATEKSQYFKDIQFRTGNFELSTFEKIIENGCTITYLYKDDFFNREKSYMKNNYLGTEFIVVDIDKCDINPIAFVESIKYKPTLLHTTFSNKTEHKENKWCFHLIYCFDTIIYGEDNFNEVFSKLTADYLTYVDKGADDCHRVIFTSNNTLPNYEFHNYGNIYKVNDFISESNIEEYDDLDGFFTITTSVANIKNTTNLISYNNIVGNEKIATTEKNTKNYINAFSLDDNFFTDLNTMLRSEFLAKYIYDGQNYNGKYEYINSSSAKDEQIKNTSDGIIYEDWRYDEYYEVSSKFVFDSCNKKFRINKVNIGQRTNRLIFDCLAFIKVNPNITKEALVTMLVYEVYKFYDNSDKELNNYKIVDIAKYGWELKEKNEIRITPVKKKFKIIISDNMKKSTAVGVLNKLFKDGEIGDNIDLMLTVEDNIKQMKDNGIKITKQRLLKFCEDYQIELYTNKQLRDMKVIQLHEENPSLSYRKLQELCKEHGIKIDYTTIQRIIQK